MGMIGLLGRVRAWTTGHWLRGVIVASTILSLIGITIGGWAYLASVALTAGQVTVDTALAAYDQGDYEEARSTVGHLLSGGRLPRNEYGGPLFVLGAIKIKDAEVQPVPERRRIEYLIASRYLTEARAYGVPAVHDASAAFLLGRSLIESGQFDAGVQVLNELAASPKPGDKLLVVATQQLLVETCLMMPHPKIDMALHYCDALIASKDVTDEQRTMAQVQRAECLSRLHRFDDARKTLTAIRAGTPVVAMMTRTILLD